jgi:hypothetical protein
MTTFFSEDHLLMRLYNILAKGVKTDDRFTNNPALVVVHAAITSHGFAIHWSEVEQQFIPVLYREDLKV